MEKIQGNTIPVSHWRQCGNCPHCGSPIFMPSAWSQNSEDDPPMSRLTCDCKTFTVVYPWPQIPPPPKDAEPYVQKAPRWTTPPGWSQS
jgi:hypothetical protein